MRDVPQLRQHHRMLNGQTIQEDTAMTTNETREELARMKRLLNHARRVYNDLASNGCQTILLSHSDNSYNLYTSLFHINRAIFHVNEIK